MNKPTKPITRDKPRRIRVVALLNTAATLVAAVVFGVIQAPKLPPLQGD